MQKLTATIATQELVGRTVLDPTLGGRFAVTEVVPEQGGVVMALIVTANSDNYVRGESFEIFLGDHGQLYATGDFLVED
jgi:hypothetical protein